MLKGYENKQLKLNADLNGQKAGATVKVAVDADGTIVDRYWRNRLRDSAKDKCVELMPDETKRASKPVAEPEKKSQN